MILPLLLPFTRHYLLLDMEAAASQLGRYSGESKTRDEINVWKRLLCRVVQDKKDTLPDLMQQLNPQAYAQDIPDAIQTANVI